jgi:hypothetical protein
VERHSCWRSCGNAIRESSTSLASAWIVPATPTAASPSPMPAMLSRHRLPQARMRGDLGKLKAGEQELAELQLLLARRRDLVIPTRVEPSLASERPLSRCFPLWSERWISSSKGPLTLLTHYQTSPHLRRAGHKRIAAYLRSRGVKGSNSVAHRKPSRVNVVWAMLRDGTTFETRSAA